MNLGSGGKKSAHIRQEKYIANYLLCSLLIGVEIIIYQMYSSRFFRETEMIGQP